MRVVYDYLKIAPSYEFMGFWKLLKNHGHPEPPFKSTMDGLNNQRNEFKHGGRLPHPNSVEGLLVVVGDFCERISQDYLHIDFNTATLTALIQTASARAEVEVAATQYAAGEIKEAVGSLRKAFAEIYAEALKRYKQDLPGRISWREPNFRQTGHPEIDHRIKDVIASLDIPLIVDRLNDVTEAINMQIFGVDPVMFWKFARLTPRIISHGFGHEVLLVWRQGGIPTPDDYEFCRSFVINFALQNGV